jgi:juvenile hormone epoxide hydrolase
MGCCLKVTAVVSLLVALLIGFYYQRLTTIPDVPSITLEHWGPSTLKADSSVKPFTIKFPQAAIDDLNSRLNRTRSLVKPLDGVAFQYGFNTDYLQKLLTFWKTEYKWRERETYLNSLPHYKTLIGGLNIHFIHAKPDLSKFKTPSKVQVIPMLLIHGWPGSIREFYGLIPRLITARPDTDFVFEVIAPSLPGYGFSDPPLKPGLGPAQVAPIFKELMDRLGFKKFVVQGGDWGSAVGSFISILYPESVIGFHTNMCGTMVPMAQLKMLLATFFPSLLVEEPLKERFAGQSMHVIEESGYMHIQATKPDTVGVALTDSPAGLAAYILEKFSTWTNRSWKNKMDGGLENYKKEDLLDNIMIYWLTNSITSSMRLYSEYFSNKHYKSDINKIPISVPTACARFPEELVLFPKLVLHECYRSLIRLTDMPKGGHFAAFEVPELLAEDIWQFGDLVIQPKKPTKTTST